MKEHEYRGWQWVIISCPVYSILFYSRSWSRNTRNEIEDQEIRRLKKVYEQYKIQSFVKLICICVYRIVAINVI